MNIKSWRVSALLLLFSTSCATAEKELVIHEVDEMTISLLRPTTVGVLLNPLVTIEGLRNEPEAVLKSSDYDLIADFLTATEGSDAAVHCPAHMQMTWVADLRSGERLVTIAGNSEWVTTEGGCRTLEGFSISDLLK